MIKTHFSLVGALVWQRFLFTGGAIIFPYIFPAIILMHALTIFLFQPKFSYQSKYRGFWLLFRLLIMGGLYILGAVLYGCRFAQTRIKCVKCVQVNLSDHG